MTGAECGSEMLLSGAVARASFYVTRVELDWSMDVRDQGEVRRCCGQIMAEPWQKAERVPYHRCWTSSHSLNDRLSMFDLSEVLVQQ